VLYKAGAVTVNTEASGTRADTSADVQWIDGSAVTVTAS
jgi:hypothetical protein